MINQPIETELFRLTIEVSGKTKKEAIGEAIDICGLLFGSQESTGITCGASSAHWNRSIGPIGHAALYRLCVKRCLAFDKLTFDTQAKVRDAVLRDLEQL